VCAAGVLLAFAGWDRGEQKIEDEEMLVGEEEVEERERGKRRQQWWSK